MPALPVRTGPPHAALALALLLGGAGPIGATLLGTVSAPLARDAAGACFLNGAPNTAARDIDPLGPAAATYRRGAAGGPVVLLLPLFGHATRGATPLLDHAALGAVRLEFTSTGAGRLAFLPGGVLRNASNRPPAFIAYRDSWNPALKRLFVSVTLRLGPCAIPLVGAFQG